MSRTFLSEIDGFTPLPELLIKRYGLITAAVFGRMWRYCQMPDGVCRASLETLAEELNISKMTVIRHIETLVHDGFLKDTTPELRNRPHIYADTGKIAMYNRFGMGVTQSDSAVTESDSTLTLSDSGSHTELIEDSIKKQVKKQDKKGDILDGMIAFGKQATERGEDKVEEVVVKLETRLRLNFPRGVKDQAVYRRILNTGKPIDRFIDWVLADEKRAAYAFLYAKDTSSLWRDFPQAFPKLVETEKKSGAFYG